MKSHRLALLAALFAFLVSACGGSDAACPASVSTPEAYVKSSVAWPQGRVRYCWENLEATTGADRRLVRDVMNTLESAAAISFDEDAACELKIFVADLAPQAFGLGTETRGVHAGLRLNTSFRRWGTDCGINEGLRQSCLRTVVLHELLHVLGFAHEQNRADTPATCADAAQGGDGDVAVGSWDKHSVMNYCNERWSNDGLLSSGDRAGLVAMYGEKGRSQVAASDETRATRAAAVCR